MTPPCRVAIVRRKRQRPVALSPLLRCRDPYGLPRIVAEILTLLGAPHPSSQAPLVVALSNELERLPARVVLVLDDHHAIRGEAVHDFLSELLRYWPQRLHLVCLSRSSPPLPLANAAQKDRSLRFVRMTCVSRRRKRPRSWARHRTAPLSRSAVALLDQRLEGWIAGLRLVTLSLGARADAETELAALSGTSVEIADYLMDEVISCQTPAILRFLLVTSILDRFCADLCECIFGDDGPPYDASACIQWLQSNNLFVIPLDNERQWYRYHHLFQELLLRRLLAEVGPAQVTELHRTAAAWFAGQGLIDEALNHALAANDFDLAAGLMQGGFCDTLNREDRATLDRWLRLLPEDFIQRRPWLLMMKAYAFQFSYQLPLWKLLDQIKALLDEGAEHTLRSGEYAPHSGDPHDLQVLPRDDRRLAGPRGVYQRPG